MSRTNTLLHVHIQRLLLGQLALVMRRQPDFGERATLRENELGEQHRNGEESSGWRVVSGESDRGMDFPALEVKSGTVHEGCGIWVRRSVN